MTQHILLTQLRRIGDVLMTTPALAALRQAYPEAWITYLTEPPSDQVFRNNPNVNEVIPFPARGSVWAKYRILRQLRARRFDLHVDFHGQPRSALMARFVGARRRIGFNFKGRAWAYTDRVERAPVPYSAAHKAHLLSPLGITVADPLPQVFPGQAERAHAQRILEGLGVGERDLLVALVPVSRQPYKVWPEAHWAHLADLLIECYDARVLLMHGPGERHFCDTVRGEMRHTALPEIPVPDLLEMAALLERAHLFLGNDGGPRHFAIAMGTPTLAPFGKVRAQGWSPPGHPLHRVVEHDPGCRRECTWPRCTHLACIKDLSFEAMRHETEALLEVILKDGRPL